MIALRRSITRVGALIIFAVLLAFQAPAPAAAQGRPLGSPTSGAITQRFSQAHSAMDIAGPAQLPGNPVVAPADGRVVYVGIAEAQRDLSRVNPNRIAHAVAINHGLIEGKYVLSFLVHMGSRTQSYATVRVGDVVRRGQRVGSQGNVGNATGVHLHWEVHVASQPYAASYATWGIRCDRSDLWFEFGGCNNRTPARAVNPENFTGPLSSPVTATPTPGGGRPVLTYIKFYKTGSNVYANFCISADSYTLQWGSVGRWDSGAPRGYGAINGCRTAVWFFSGVTDPQETLWVQAVTSAGGIVRVYKATIRQAGTNCQLDRSDTPLRESVECTFTIA